MLLSDYIFNNSAGNHAGRSPFTISGLESASMVDLYFYKRSGSVAIPGATAAAFGGAGIFTPASTVYFHNVPVSAGTVKGSFGGVGGDVTVIYGMTILLPAPQPGRVGITRQDNDPIISWSGTGTLQSADKVSGFFASFRMFCGRSIEFRRLSRNLKS